MTEQIGWPLAIATPSGDRMVLRAATDPATSLWLSRRRVGAETPVLNSSSGLVAYSFSSEGERVILRQLLANSADPWNRERAASGAALALLTRPVLDNGFAFQPPPGNNPETSIAFPIFVGGRYVASLLMTYMTQAMNSATAVARYVPHLRMLAARIGEAAGAHRDDLDIDELAFPSFQAITVGQDKPAAFARI